MKTLITVAFVAFCFTAVQADQASDLELEPCINGGVSAGGLYPTQTAEDLATSRHTETEAGELAYEPCVNGGVSSSGRYPNRGMEDVMERGTASAR